MFLERGSKSIAVADWQCKVQQTAIQINNKYINLKQYLFSSNWIKQPTVSVVHGRGEVSDATLLYLQLYWTDVVLGQKLWSWSQGLWFWSWSWSSTFGPGSLQREQASISESVVTGALVKSYIDAVAVGLSCCCLLIILTVWLDSWLADS